ncbi:MAG: hypothetical protein IJ716_04930 [Lachnospiraceae bacterium]|nr:hypothetical protein [Lachnospiraceae bacterium]
MYKYKPARYIFRALNLVVYAMVISFAVILVLNDMRISELMQSYIGDYYMDATKSLYLAGVLIGNVIFLLLFKAVSKKENGALLYYICDFIMRISFSIPLALAVVYFLFWRFAKDAMEEPIAQGIVFLLFFGLFDWLIQTQIRCQLGVNYFRVHDQVE